MISLPGRWHPRIRLDWALLLVLAFAAFFRLQYVDLPMAEAHSWRQITNADIARHFYERSLNILYPRVSWGGGGDSYVGMEFPLLQWLGGLLFHVLGERHVVCRGIAIAFSLATVVALYGLGTHFWGRPAGRAAAFLFAVSPSAVFFGRTFISDTPMICFSAVGVWGFASYLDTGSRRALAWGTISAALACMVKVPAVIVLAPIAFLGWQERGWRVVRDRRFVGALGIVLLLTIGWYVHADVLFHRTGLGQAIWHPSGTYGPDVMVAAGPMMQVSHWSTFHQLRDAEFYATLLQRTWNLHLTPPGLAIVLFAATLLLRTPRRGFVDVWFATVVLFILVSAEGQRWHEFHQLPMLLPAALYFAFAARPAFDGAWLARLAPAGLGLAGAILVLGSLGWMGIHYSGVVPHMFRPEALNLRPISVGHAVRGATPHDALLITVEYAQYGANSPIVLYHAERQGWSFDVSSITPHVVQRLRSRLGATHFVTLIWSEIRQKQPELARFLEAQDRIPVDMDDDVALFRLR